MSLPRETDTTTLFASHSNSLNMKPFLFLNPGA